MFDGGVFLGRNPASGVELRIEDLFRKLRAFPHSQCILSSYKSIFFDCEEGNREVLAVQKKFPRQVFASAYLHPFAVSLNEAESYLIRLKKSGIRILSFFTSPHYYETRFDSAVFRELFFLASRLGFILVLGVEKGSDLSLITQCCSSVETPVLIRWMSGRGYLALNDILLSARQNSNFLFDVGSLSYSGAISWLVKEIGAERLFAATHFPEGFSAGAPSLVLESSLSANEKLAILSGNLERLFGIKKPSRPSLSSEIASVQKLMRIPKIDTHWHTEHWGIVNTAQYYSESDLFDRYNYIKVIFSSIRALNGDVLKGNADLWKCIKSSSRYYGLVVVDPLSPDLSLKQIDGFVRQGKCVGLKTIQDLYGLPLCDKLYQPFLDRAQKLNLTVMAHIPGIESAAKKYPNVRFVCAHAAYQRVRQIERLPNLYFDIATSLSSAAETQLMKLIEQFTVEKILYSTDGPLVHPVWTLAKLAELSLPKESWRKIFYENALEAFPALKD